jgi:hypothetical protein
MMSRVDVIVPCYKYAHFLRECVESVLAQPVDVRVLILDDASPDDTPEVAADLVARDGRVEYRRHKVNQGHIATYNEGIEWAGSDYLLLLKLMDDHPEVGFTYGRAITTDCPDPAQLRPPGGYRWRVLTGGEFWELSCRDACNIVSTPTAVVRTSLQKALGGYRKELPHTGDLEMWLRFAAHAAVGVLDCDQGYYRVHGKNMHKMTYTSSMTVLRQHHEAFETLFQEYGDRIPDCERMMRMALRGTAINALRRAAKFFEQGEAEACDRLRDAALLIFPELRDEREWSRLRLKQVMGHNLCRALVPLLARLRRRRIADPSPFGLSGVFPGV